MTQSHTDWLADWYRKQCNDEWEHSYGVVIDTIDNPGWRLKIDLVDTPFEDVPFEKLERNVEDEVNWLVCLKEGKTFVGHGGALQLSEMISVFRKWIDETESQPIKTPSST